MHLQIVSFTRSVDFGASLLERSCWTIAAKLFNTTIQCVIILLYNYWRILVRCGAVLPPTGLSLPQESNTWCHLVSVQLSQARETLHRLKHNRAIQTTGDGCCLSFSATLCVYQLQDEDIFCQYQWMKTIYVIIFAGQGMSWKSGYLY